MQEKIKLYKELSIQNGLSQPQITYDYDGSIIFIKNPQPDGRATSFREKETESPKTFDLPISQKLEQIDEDQKEERHSDEAENFSDSEKNPFSQRAKKKAPPEVKHPKVKIRHSTNQVDSVSIGFFPVSPFEKIVLCRGVNLVRSDHTVKGPKFQGDVDISNHNQVLNYRYKNPGASIQLTRRQYEKLKNGEPIEDEEENADPHASLPNLSY